ncbi:MAG: DUF3710 domain-containing protein [Nocardiopsaceae bacterium]|jgi:hypothetical protein|nr:DUF3710 domain-containing protein [Nocardiopsaceae bacterium]
MPAVSGVRRERQRPGGPAINWVGEHEVLRRRRRESDQHDPYAPDDQNGQLAVPPEAGPWDVADEYPDSERVDCGSLLVPVREGFDVQINVAEEQGAWVAIVNGDSGMQLQAFAAPRTGGLWDEVRHEIAANIADSGGSCQEIEGPAGTELRAQVPVGEEDAQRQPGQNQPGQNQPVRFLGYDGPRWFLRGVVSGPAATEPQMGAPFDELFADVVVVRGDYPAPPREQLEIRLPEEARQALEEQFAQEHPGWDLPDPFTRGPEITETR